MLDAVKSWPNGKILYDAVNGINSNSGANYLGGIGGFVVTTPPPGATGWDNEPDLQLQINIEKEYSGSAP
jgi:hypothetical protein